jgi:hypothetical protein
MLALFRLVVFLVSFHARLEMIYIILQTFEHEPFGDSTTVAPGKTTQVGIIEIPRLPPTAR